MDSLGWLFPDSTRLRRKELIITTFLYTHCRSSRLKKGFLIGPAGVDLEALFFLAIFVSVVTPWCLGSVQISFCTIFSLRGSQMGTCGFQVASGLRTRLSSVSS